MINSLHEGLGSFPKKEGMIRRRAIFSIWANLVYLREPRLNVCVVDIYTETSSSYTGNGSSEL